MMNVNTLGLVLITAFVVLFSGIGIILILLHQRNKKKAHESLSWPETTGTIIKSKVAVGESVFSSGDDDGGQSQPMYSAEITYNYQVGDMLYTSERISFAGKTSYSKPDKAEAVTRQYPEGSTVRVFYDPEKREVAVLERSAKGSGALLVAGIIFLSIGLFSLIVGVIILI